MKLILLQPFIAFLIFFGPSSDLPTYRKMMERSVDDDIIADQFYNKCKSIGESSPPIYLGYKAMSEFMLCNHVFSPMAKWSHFKKGRKILEEAILRSGEDTELRFLRFSVQSRVPAILNYSDNLYDDKLVLMEYLKKEPQDKDLYNRIKAYLLQTKYCNTVEKERIKTL